jgi:hypothetical protein
MNHYVSDLGLPEEAQNEQQATSNAMDIEATPNVIKVEATPNVVDTEATPDAMDIDQPEAEDDGINDLIQQFELAKVSAQEPPPDMPQVSLAQPRPQLPMLITQESRMSVAVNIQANIPSNEGDLNIGGRSSSAPPSSGQLASGFPAPRPSPFSRFAMSGPMFRSGDQRSSSTSSASSGWATASESGENDDWVEVSVDQKKRYLKAAYEICLRATRKQISNFRRSLEERMPTMTGKSEELDPAEPKEEYEAMILYRRGEPTNCLASNVSLINSIIWQRGVALRLLTPDAEYNAQKTMQSASETSELISDWVSLDGVEGTETLNQTYGDIYDLASEFLSAVGEKKALEELETLVPGQR